MESKAKAQMPKYPQNSVGAPYYPQNVGRVRWEILRTVRKGLESIGIDEEEIRELVYEATGSDDYELFIEAIGKWVRVIKGSAKRL